MSNSSLKLKRQYTPQYSKYIELSEDRNVISNCLKQSCYLLKQNLENKY